MNTTTVHIILCRIVALLLLITATLHISSTYGNRPAGSTVLYETSTDSILIHTQRNSRSHKISLYTDAEQKAIFFQVRGNDGQVYQLYIFDLEGNVIRQLETRNKQTAVIKSMEKGIYLFDVFSDDDKIGNGQIDIRRIERML